MADIMSDYHEWFVQYDNERQSTKVAPEQLK